MNRPAVLSDWSLMVDLSRDRHESTAVREWARRWAEILGGVLKENHG